MKINNIIVRNFRSIKEAHVSVEDIVALVGENNVGKSALLRAINSFFNFEDERKAFEDEDHRHASKTQYTDIIITFSIISGKTKEMFADYINNSNLTIRFRYSYKTKKRTYSYKSGITFENLSENHEVLIYIDKYIQFVYIPVERTIDDVDFATESLFKKVIEETLKAKTESRDSISPRLKNELGVIESRILKNIASNIDKYYLLTHNFTFKVQFKGNIDYSIILNDIELKINDLNRDFNLKDCGSGVISMSIISMHLILAELRHSNVVFGIEEPEINLHPQAQKELILNIKENSKINQLLLTTHSPIIIDQLDHHKVILVKREYDNKKNVQSNLYQLSKSFFEDNGIKEFSYYQFFNYRNSEFFFSKIVILAESKNDAQVIDHLLARYNIDTIKNGISILNLEGVKNFRYPYYLLEQLKIPRMMVVDKDFFTNYKNNSLDQSRDVNGFPEYKGNLNKKKFLKNLTKKESSVVKFEDYLSNNKHTEILNFLEDYNIVCMKYNLECDLISTSQGKAQYWEELNISSKERTTNKLLLENSEKIKDINILMKVLSGISKNGLPHSYKRIPKIITELIQKMK
ncbi:ATP-dependent nuclease [Paenibacillus nitricinens]|uniref:ATP-dependent nuclease n=1 Tax=Paenibacillus nitricinens TaxID=3367691 RepID=UPI003F8768EB